MATNRHTTQSAVRRTLQVLAIASAAAVMGAGHSKTLPTYGLDDDDGRDMAAETTHRPTVEAGFPLESYRPGTTARLVITDKAPRVSIEVRHVGSEVGPVRSADVMTGVPVTEKHTIGSVSRRKTV